MTQKTMFQFPGQGSQVVGMGGALAGAFPEACAVFDEVNDALGEDLFALMQDGPEEELRLTRNAQPALFATDCYHAAAQRRYDVTWLPLSLREFRRSLREGQRPVQVSLPSSNCFATGACAWGRGSWRVIAWRMFDGCGARARRECWNRGSF